MTGRNHEANNIINIKKTCETSTSEPRRITSDNKITEITVGFLKDDCKYNFVIV